MYRVINTYSLPNSLNFCWNIKWHILWVVQSSVTDAGGRYSARYVQRYTASSVVEIMFTQCGPHVYGFLQVRQLGPRSVRPLDHRPFSPPLLPPFLLHQKALWNNPGPQWYSRCMQNINRCNTDFLFLILTDGLSVKIILEHNMIITKMMAISTWVAFIT